MRAFEHRLLLAQDAFDHRLLAVEATDARAAAALLHPLVRLFIGVDLMQLPHRALVRVARVGAAHARRIGGHGAHFLRDGFRVLAQADGVAVRLRHLLPVETRHARRFRQEHLRLDENQLARAFQIAEQAFAVAHRQALRFLQHCAGLFERLVVAFLLIRDAQFVIQLRALAAELLRGFERLLFEVRLLAVEIVEAARDLARHFDVRHLVFADRHQRRAIQQNVRRHQHRIAEKAVRGQVLSFSFSICSL